MPAKGTKKTTEKKVEEKKVTEKKEKLEKETKKAKTVKEPESDIKVSKKAKEETVVEKKEEAPKKVATRSKTAIAEEKKEAKPKLIKQLDLNKAWYVHPDGRKEFIIEANVGGQTYRIDSYELPESYGETRIFLMAQDPYWMHAYWEITENDKKKFGYYNKKVVLRVYNMSSNTSFDIEINKDAKSWYINIQEPMRPYYVEIGVIESNGSFQPIIKSNVIITPPSASGKADENWQLPEDKMEEIFKKSGGYLIHKQVGSQVITEWVAAPSGVSSGGSSGGISSGSGGMAMNIPQKQRKFWAELYTELIVYGATEPDAKVTVGGVPTKLTPDGRFTLRFFLKDGEHPIPFVATSADEVDTITITPFVTQTTTRTEVKNKDF